MKCLLLILLPIISWSASAQELPGLVAGWKMDSNCELMDVSESSQANGVLVDVSLTVNSDNEPQSALSFNLSSSYITLGSVSKLKLSNDKSISFRVRPVLTGTTHTGSIFSFGTGINIQYQEQSSIPKLNIIFGNTSYLQANLTANQWQLITITFKKDYNITKSKVVYYVNGIKTHEAEQDKSQHDFDRSIAIVGAQDQNTLTNGFHGSLDDLKIYDRTLTDAEVQHLELPVTLEYFMAKKTNNLVEIRWKAQLEENVFHFEIQKSTDGFSFQKITQVAAGNYNFMAYDAAGISGGIVWYRLLITDRAGKANYSNVITINFDKQDVSAVKLYPNPGSGFIRFIGASANGSIAIANNAGMIVIRKKLSAGNIVDISQLHPGFYNIVFYDGNKRLTSKFIKR